MESNHEQPNTNAQNLRKTAVDDVVRKFAVLGYELTNNDIECLMKADKKNFCEVIRMIASRFNVDLV